MSLHNENRLENSLSKILGNMPLIASNRSEMDHIQPDYSNSSGRGGGEQLDSKALNMEDY